jgi:hypothetical protein
LLKKIAIFRERVVDGESYPFSIPVIHCLEELTFRSRICFFTGENGTGKSTLLEAIAAHYGFGREGGNRNFQNDSTDSNHSVDALVRALRLSFDKRTGAGYFLRAESFFNTVSHMDALDKEPSYAPPISAFYGGQSLHTRSHRLQGRPYRPQSHMLRSVQLCFFGGFLFLLGVQGGGSVGEFARFFGGHAVILPANTSQRMGTEVTRLSVLYLEAGIVRGETPRRANEIDYIRRM